MFFIGDLLFLSLELIFFLYFSPLNLRLTTPLNIFGVTMESNNTPNDPSSNFSSNVTPFHNTMNPASAHLMRCYTCSNFLVTPSTNTQTPTNSSPSSDDNPSSSTTNIIDIVLHQYQNSNASNEIVPYDPGVQALLDEVKRAKQNKISLSTREQYRSANVNCILFLYENFPHIFTSSLSMITRH